MSDDSKQQIDQLRAEVEKLKAAQPPTYDHAAAAAWADHVHQIREARATRAAAVGFSKADLAAMRAAAPDDVCRAIAMRDNRAPTGRPGTIPIDQQQPTSVRGVGVPPGGGTGWQTPAPLRPPEGVRQADRLMDAQDRRDRHDLMMAEAKRAFLKTTEPK
jgi:hypothetical protein